MSKLFTVCAVLLMTTNFTAYSQTKDNPVSYTNVQWCGALAYFSFEDLGERTVLETSKMTFYAPERIELRFRVKIRPDGTVSYVAPARGAQELAEYRKGGASALYGYRFSSVKSEGDQWVQVNMVVGE